MLSRRHFGGCILALALVFQAGLAQAQLETNLGALSGDNAKGYLSPLPKALSGTLNSAVFRTGDVPKQGLNFVLSVNAMSVSFGDDEQTFRPTAPEGFTPTADVDAPTVIGDAESVLQPGEAGTAIYYPGGFDIDDFSVAVPQLEIGSVMGTRAVVRYVAFDLGDEGEDLGKLELLGAGIQHSISQYFPTMPVDLALGGFYQKFDIGEDLLQTRALHVDVTGSKTFGVLKPYAAVGFDNFEFEAHYDSDSLEEPIDVELDTESNVHLTGGLAAVLPGVQAHIEYNIAAENGVSFGVGVGF